MSVWGEGGAAVHARGSLGGGGRPGARGGVTPLQLCNSIALATLTP